MRLELPPLLGTKGRQVINPKGMRPLI